MSDNVLAPDTAFALLRNERRRHLLCILARRDAETPLQGVAKDIVARLDDGEPGDSNESAYRSVYVSLYQNHVPRLAEAGIVEYDEDERTVELVSSGRTQQLLSLLGCEYDEPDRSLYSMVFGTSFLVAAGSVAGFLPVLVSPLLVPILIALLGLLSIETHHRVTADSLVVDPPFAESSHA